MFDKTEEIIEALYGSIPYSNQIKNLKISEHDEVYFTWRGKNLKAVKSGHIDEVEGGCLVGSDSSMLLAHIVKLYWINKES